MSTTDNTVADNLADGAFAFLIVFGSLAIGLLMILDPVPVGDYTAAAWAWCIGAATGLWVIPWAKGEYE